MWLVVRTEPLTDGFECYAETHWAGCRTTLRMPIFGTVPQVGDDLMLCPVCQEHLDAETYADLRVMTCGRCKGLWIGGKDVRLLVDRSDSPIDLQGLKDRVRAGSESVRRGSCPECQSNKLCLIRLGRVEIEACPVCLGLFFDERELDRAFRELRPGKPAHNLREALASEGVVLVLIQLFAAS